MDTLAWLRKQLAQASPDLLREMVQDFAEALMGAEAEALCGAAYGERSPERVNTRNGYRPRSWATGVGTTALAVPTLRTRAAAGRAARRRPPPLGRRPHPTAREAGADVGDRADLEDPGLAPGGQPR